MAVDAKSDANLQYAPHLAHDDRDLSHDNHNVDVEQGHPLDNEAEGSSRRDDSILPITSPKQASERLVADQNRSSVAARWDMVRIRAYLLEEVDTDAATGPLSAFCFMTASHWLEVRVLCYADLHLHIVGICA